MQVQKRALPLPHPQRLDLALVQPLAQRRARADVGDRAPTAASCPSRSRSSSCRHGMAERYEVIIDFSKSTTGQRDRAAQRCDAKNNVDYDHTNKIMKFEVGRRRRLDNEHGAAHSRGRPADARTPRRGDGPHGARRRSRPRNIRVRARRHDHVDDQRRDLARRRRQRLPDVRRRPRARHDRGLGDREQVGRLVPPGPHPPHRLQDPQPQRQARPSPTSGPQGRRLRRRGRDGARDREVRPARGPVHDPLPQPRPRGPRHDAPVGGRQGRPAPWSPHGDDVGKIAEKDPMEREHDLPLAETDC